MTDFSSLIGELVDARVEFILVGPNWKRFRTSGRVGLLTVARTTES